MAGAFSPLAFAWLVLGFIQQGVELRQNSAALILQAEELKSAAKHAGDMVELQRKDLELRIEELEKARTKAQAVAEENARRLEAIAVKKAQPSFSFGLFQRDSARKKYAAGRLSNHGQSCTNVRLEMDQVPTVIALLGTTEFEKFDSELSVEIKMFSANSQHTHPLVVHYTDSLGTQRSQSFIVSSQSDYVRIVESSTQN